jgi:hypothetical protein
VDFSSDHLKLAIDSQLCVQRAESARGLGLVGPAPTPLVEITLQRPEQREPEQTLGPGAFAWQAAASCGADTEFTGRGRTQNITLSVRITTSRDDALHVGVSVTNNGDTPVSSVAFTPLAAIPAATGEQLQAAIPHNAGWIVPLARLPVGQRIHVTYPTHLSMQWVDLFGEAFGLYLACYDSQPYLKHLVIERRDASYAVLWRYTDLHLQTGQSISLPPFVITGHDGNWWAGAERYRAWIRSWLTDATPPAWMTECPAWFWSSLKPQRAPRPTRAYRDVATVSRQVNAVVNVPQQVAAWMRNGHDTNFPDFEADEAMGGEEGLAAAIAQVQQDGLRVSLYTNARLVDPDSHFGRQAQWQDQCVHLPPCAQDTARMVSDTFTRRPPATDHADAQEAWSWDHDAIVAKEQYGSVVFGVACPSSPRWREHYAERIERIVARFRPNGVYFDQVCGAGALPCYSSQHDHEHPALAWRGYRTLMRALREIVQRHRTDAYVAVEGIGDIIGESIDVFQAHNDWDEPMLSIGTDTPELFRVAFPRRLILIGPTYEPHTRYLRLGHAVAAGFDLTHRAVREPDSVQAQLAARVVALRRALDRFRRSGVPTPTVRATTPGVRVFALTGTGEGGLPFCLINGAWLPSPDEALPEHPFEITVQTEMPVANARLYDERRDAVPIEPIAAVDGIRFSIPPTPIFSIVLD